MIQVDVIRFGVDVIQIDLIKNYGIFAPNFFNFKIILSLGIFVNAVASTVFTFNFFCAIPWRATIGDIRSSYVKEVEAPNVSLWDSALAIPK